jgi:hypothetical protein
LNRGDSLQRLPRTCSLSGLERRSPKASAADWLMPPQQALK